MKLFWEFADFQVWECCKNNQIKKKIEQIDVWWCSDRRYLTSELTMVDII